LVAMACVVLVIGAVIVYGLWKICKKIPGPPATDPPPPPPGTNAPPKTNTNRVAHLTLKMPDKDLHVDGQWQMNVSAFESSEDMVHWSRALYFTNWFGASNIVSVAADDYGPVATNWMPAPWTNGEVICDFGNLQALLPDGDRKLYRMVELQ
jgi:hypothetical protein